VYAHFGVNIPAQSGSISNSPDGRKFYSIDDAKPGDVCWWEGHVALYIGGGKIVHTNTSDPTNNKNLIHVSTISGDGADYRFPSAFIRFVDDEALTGSGNGVGGIFGDTGSSAVQDQVSNAISTSSLVTESDLTGMPTEWSLEDYQAQVNLMSLEDLPLKDRIGLGAISEGMRNSEGTTSSIFNIISMVAGYILMVYALLLGIAVIFDSTNSYIDISFLSLLTFGHWHLLLDGSDGMSEGKGLKPKGAVVRILVVAVVAVLLASGWLAVGLSRLLAWLF